MPGCPPRRVASRRVASRRVASLGLALELTKLACEVAEAIRGF
jgi:hypothetical protein